MMNHVLNSIATGRILIAALLVVSLFGCGRQTEADCKLEAAKAPTEAGVAQGVVACMEKSSSSASSTMNVKLDELYKSKKVTLLCTLGDSPRGTQFIIDRNNKLFNHATNNKQKGEITAVTADTVFAKIIDAGDGSVDSFSINMISGRMLIASPIGGRAELLCSELR